MIEMHDEVREGLPGVKDVKIEFLPYEKVTGHSRQKCMDMVTGDVITWFDDDDYFSPNRLALMEEIFNKSYTNIAYLSATHHLDMETNQMYNIEWEPLLIGGVAVQADLAKLFKFEPILIGEDADWLGKIFDHLHRGNRKMTKFKDPVPGCYVLHNENIWGGVKKRGWDAEYASEATVMPFSEYLDLLPKDEAVNFKKYLKCFTD